MYLIGEKPLTKQLASIYFVRDPDHKTSLKYNFKSFQYTKICASVRCTYFFVNGKKVTNDFYVFLQPFWNHFYVATWANLRFWFSSSQKKNAGSIRYAFINLPLRLISFLLPVNSGRKDYYTWYVLKLPTADFLPLLEILSIRFTLVTIFSPCLIFWCFYLCLSLQVV